MFNASFVVWREALEAILVVGILYAWLSRGASRERALPWLWGGVAGGVLLALLLGSVLLLVQSELTGTALELFQAVMVLFAAALITQMVIWMHRHGRALRAELEHQAASAVERARWWGVATLAAIAVGREGAETVIFVYGLALEHHGVELTQWFAAAGAGLVAAALTAWALNRGSRVVSWRSFFRVSETVLLLLATSLLVAGIEKLIGLELLPAVTEPVWDTTGLLDDGRGIGSVLATFAGYRAQPSLTLVLVFGAYWAAVAALLHYYAARPLSPVRRS
jgi:high-affinity iron transporter